MSDGYSIFIPTHGSKFLLRCVESVLNQCYSKFDLVILKSHGEDDITRQIRQLNDSRIKVWVVDEALNIEDNWRRIVDSKKRRHMTILGHDDILDSNFLGAIDKLIQQYPQGGIYQTHFRLIDEDSKIIRPCRPIPFRESAPDYLASRLNFVRDSYATGYVFCSTDYNDLGGIPLLPDLLFSDDVLWMQLMEKSDKFTCKEITFSYRYHKNSTSYTPCEEALFNSLLKFSDYVYMLSKRNAKAKQVISNYWEPYVKYYSNRFLEYKSEKGELGTVELERVNKLFSLFGITDRYKKNDITRRRNIKNIQHIMNYVLPINIQDLLKTVVPYSILKRFS